MKAWLLIAAGADRQHGGNDGYADNLAEQYCWDDTVPNHGSLAIGDFIVLWDKKQLLGASVIEHISKCAGLKARYRCPARHCGQTKIKLRQVKLPVYRCHECRHEFDDPIVEQIGVTTYRSEHGKSWVDLQGLLSGAELRKLCEKPRSQHAMRLLRWESFVEAIDEARLYRPRLDDLMRAEMALNSELDRSSGAPLGSPDSQHRSPER